MRKDFGTSYNLHRKDRRLVYRNEHTPLNRSEVWKTYKQFLRDSKVSPKNFLTKEEVAEITDVLFEEIERSWTENTAGILLKGFGYFTVLAQKKTKVKPTVNMVTTKFHFFHPVFIPYEDNTEWKFFSMDGTIRRRIKTKVIRRSHLGYKYMNMIYSMKDENRMSRKLISHRDKIRNDGEF